MSEQDALSAAAARSSKAARDAFAAAIRDRQANIDRQVYGIISRREVLTPELAVQLWVEKASLEKLVRDMEKSIRVGEAAGRRLQNEINRAENR